jgi:hypothetical protein
MMSMRGRISSAAKMALVLAIGGGATGCMQALSVSRGNSEKLKGVPFYMKAGVFRQHTVRRHSTLRLTLTFAPVIGTGTDGAEKLGTKATYEREVDDTPGNWSLLVNVSDAIRAFQTNSGGGANMLTDAILTAFSAIPRYPSEGTSSPDTSGLSVVANFVERLAVVDYSTKYYLNARRPLFGSATVAAELGPDGTLAKGSADVKSDLPAALTAAAGAVSGLVPVKEFLTARLIPVKPDTGGVHALDIPKGVVAPVVRVEFTLVQKIVTYDFVRDSEKDPVTAGQLTPLSADFVRGLFTVRETPDGAGEAGDQNAVTFTGKVQLPAPKKP